MDYGELPYFIEPMQLWDIHEVMEIERASFPTPWSARSYEYELRQNDLSHFFVARRRLMTPAEPVLEQVGWRSRLRHLMPPRSDSPRSIVGYGGFWLMAGEAHISTIAVRPGYRGRGIGELLLVAMIERAVELGAAVMTLEVRVSNLVAQNLYQKYGFQQVGRRKRYYSDSGEDGLIMSTDVITSAHFQARFQALRAALVDRLREATKDQ